MRLHVSYHKISDYLASTICARYVGTILFSRRLVLTMQKPFMCAVFWNDFASKFYVSFVSLCPLSQVNDVYRGVGDMRLNAR